MTATSAKNKTVWPLEPHTRAKHDLLQGYLAAWFPILAKYNKRLIFLDGFAGPGVYEKGEPGSPPIALQTLLDHSYFPQMAKTEFVFLFNEQEPNRHASLEGIVTGIRGSRTAWPSNVTVHVENKNFTELADEILQQVGTRGLAPTFAFLDPFGYRDVPISLISKLLASPKSELFIYFDFNSTMRFSTAGNVDEHFEALFGTDQFKNAPAAGDPHRQQFLHDLYRSQLSKLCGFPFVQSFEMVNATGKTGHYLFFCTRNVLGLDQMKSVMWKLAPLGNYRFTDILAGQDVLFMEDVNVEPLKAALTQHFAGSTVLIAAIEDYVMTQTPYVKSHIRTRTLKPMQAAGMISSPNQKQVGRFPDGTFVRFP